MPNRKTRAEVPFRHASARLSDRLREGRLRKQWSQQQLAVQAEVSIGTVRKIETNQTVEPGFFTIVAIAHALDEDVHDFL